ncbi:MAG: cytochrome c oxidase subunit I [Planctomycetes bacterium]|nr:cytochrome c oxidase subunit I [Planctomycetota bacterium]
MTTTQATLTGLYGMEGETNYINHQKGLWSWLSTLDHKRIGLMYLACILGAFGLGGFFAIMVRTEHLTGGETIMGANTYNQMFTLHGAVMVFLFIIPGIPAALGNFCLPLMIGAKDVAFPRLNLMSWYLWVTGATFFVLALALGGLDTGWTFYTPYSSSHSPYMGVIPAVFGAFILGFSSILTAVNFLATIHTLRAPGMGWFQMPLFIWALYATAIIQILATPVLAITLLLLIAERALQIGIFDPALGGDPVLFQHFFWFYSHPAVYIMILPAMGVVSELIGTGSHKSVFGYKFIAFSSIAIAILGFLVWGHHMFVSGQSTLAGTIFSLITFTIAIPSAVKVFNWLATMYKGAIELTPGMLYGLSFIWVFSIGGLTGLPLATMATDVHLHDTYFVVAHFHYVMVGGTVFAFLGGLHHWWPKMFGKMYNQFWSVVAWVFIFVGFNLTFFPQFIMGSRGMPRRYWHYLPEFHAYHVASTMGAYMQLAGFLTLAVVLIYSLMKGKKAPVNPWGATTLEWQTNSPPPFTNFDEANMPVGGEPYDYENVEYRPETNDYIRVRPQSSAEHH